MYHPRFSVVISFKCIEIKTYRNTGTNSVVGQLYFKNKCIEKIRFVVTRDQGLGEGELDETVKKYKLPVVRLSTYQGCDVQHDKYTEHVIRYI